MQAGAVFSRLHSCFPQGRWGPFEVQALGTRLHFHESLSSLSVQVLMEVLGGLAGANV